MSVHLMSAIFQTEFRDLQDEEGRVTKASTAKFVLLAMADHANDEGEGAYPSIESLKKKCALSEQTIRNTFDALLYNGIIFRVGTSKYMTHNHTINIKAFPASENRRDFPPIIIEVKPVEGLTGGDEGSNRYLKGVNPVDPNHNININNKPDMLDMLLEQEAKAQPIHNACLAFENALLGSTVSAWPWDSNSKWQKFAKWVAAQDPADFQRYAEWRKSDGKFHAMSNNKIRQDPQMFIDTGWPTFLAHSSMYQKKDRSFGL